MQWPADEESAAAYVAEKTNRAYSATTLSRDRRAGKIGFLRVGKSPRYRQADLDAFIEGMYRPAKASA